MVCISILVAALVSQVGSIPTRSLAPEQPANYFLASTSTPNATIAVSPNATIDLNRSMKQIKIELSLNNTPDVPPFNSIQMLLHYNVHALNASNLDFSTLDYSTNVFAQTSYSKVILADCIDGHAANNGPSNLCGSSDGPGYISFAESILGGTTPDGTQGNIFFQTFSVNTTAPNFSQIQIVRAIIGNGQVKDGQPVVIPVTTSDGYYTSKSCGNPPVPCAPALATFTWSPPSPTQNQIIVFNGGASRPSPGAFIMNYSWSFDDSQSTGTYVDTGRNPVASHLYKIPSIYYVTLQITDNSTVIVSKTNRVVVANAEKDVGIESLDVQPSVTGVLPGTVFRIKVVLRNFGGVAVNASLTLTLAGPAPQLLGSLPLARMNASATRVLTATWDSSGRIPNVYRIDALTPIQKDQTSTDKNLKSVYILLIYPFPAGLSLLGVAGITGVVVVAGGYGVSFLRKRNLNLDDAL